MLRVISQQTFNMWSAFLFVCLLEHYICPVTVSSVQIDFLALSESLGPVHLVHGRTDFYTVFCFLTSEDVSLEHPQVIVHSSSFVETGTLDHNLKDLSKRVHTVYLRA